MWLLRGWPGRAVGVQLPGGVGVACTDCSARAPLSALAIGGTTGDGRTVGTGVGMTATLASDTTPDDFPEPVPRRLRLVVSRFLMLAPVKRQDRAGVFLPVGD